MTTERFVFKRTDTIGAADALDDDYLVGAFVDAGFLEVLRDCGDARQILVGRTGAGKSALLRVLAEREERVVQIAPETLSLSYISNSNILKYFDGLGVNLEPFFKLLWRHVLVVELLRKRFPINSEAETEGWLSRLFSRVDRKQKRAIEYLKNWGEKFWEDTDYRIKEVTQSLETKLEGALGSAKRIGSMAASRTLNEKQTAEVVQRAQHIVNEVQVKELNEVIGVVDSVLADDQKRFYATIDRLDEEWVEDGLRLRLIRALIESVTAFKRVRNAKVIVALREDLVHRVFRETSSSGFQREKYEARMLRIWWEDDELEQLMDRRIQALVRRRYTKRAVSLREILPTRMGRRTQAIDSVTFILERTLRRPRDAIAFVNCAIARSAGKAEFTPRLLRDAEEPHSLSRLNAVLDEWVGHIPGLKVASECLRNKRERFEVSELDQDQILKCMVGLYSVGSQGGMLSAAAQAAIDGDAAWESFRALLIATLYQTGFVGVKLPGKSMQFVGERLPALTEEKVTPDLRITVHRMFHKALGIRSR